MSLGRRPGVGQVIEVRAVRLELGQVGLREMDALGVKRFQVAIEELAGHRLIEWLLQIVVPCSSWAVRLAIWPSIGPGVIEVEAVGGWCGASGCRGLVAGGGANCRLSRPQRQGQAKGSADSGSALGGKTFNHDVLRCLMIAQLRRNAARTVHTNSKAPTRMPRLMRPASLPGLFAPWPTSAPRLWS